MAIKSKRGKPGPRSPWQLRLRYQRSRCMERLKPNQIENLAAADAFARWIGMTLNCFVTIHFGEHPHPKHAFETAIDRLSKWHRRWGGEWAAIHVWEATGGFHVHLACHCPKNPDAVHGAIRNAFAGYDVHIRARTRGQAMMAYLCKGTDMVTHSKLHGPRHIKARKQGVITWKRCGTTQNIGKSARMKSGFEAQKSQNNCAKTSLRRLDVHGRQRTDANTSGGIDDARATYVVSPLHKNALRCSHEHGSRERVASGDLDASRHTLPDH